MEDQRTGEAVKRLDTESGIASRCGAHNIGVEISDLRLVLDALVVARNRVAFLEGQLAAKGDRRTLSSTSPKGGG